MSKVWLLRLYSDALAIYDVLPDHACSKLRKQYMLIMRPECPVILPGNNRRVTGQARLLQYALKIVAFFIPSKDKFLYDQRAPPRVINTFYCFHSRGFSV